MADSYGGKFGTTFDTFTPGQRNADRIIRLEVLVVSALSVMREQKTPESEAWQKEASELLNMADPK